MKAFRLEAPGAPVLADIPDVRPGAGETLLRVKLVGFCGTDLNTWRGRNPMVIFPRVLGHEVAAEVVCGGADLPVGSSVTISPYTSCGACPACANHRPNACQRNQTMGVQRDGAMTEYISVPRENIYTGNLGLTELCLVEPLTVGFHAVSRGRVTAQDTVAVFGCGGVGLGAIAGSAFRGATTIAIDMDDAKLAIGAKAGAKHLIHTGREDLHARLQEITSGKGPDVIIEAIGLPSMFRAAVEQVAFTGRVVYVGYAKEPVSYETRLFVQKELDILGSRNALPEDFREVIRMLESGMFPVEEAVSAVIAMEDAGGMLAEWSEAPERFTKIIIAVS
ncbi:threonine dehydrogenase-like Zn-dependent dehydrogenase [Granulicella aggregans]|uniref:Threonine dehydrogenase-like Zn-dependent dehydrogenase n=1 Tax=Granulicella aggregans TaxID=474949 RepID=A0A7W7ZIT1_9BACT|nr:zinc-binding alcohol dehydrogenase family protein [Granulicella aggregans]MBB5060697.1 threonine dehydrogenase-like Zn-dependent dehydrogenase [Granulicella aggregans]